MATSQDCRAFLRIRLGGNALTAARSEGRLPLPGGLCVASLAALGLCRLRRRRATRSSSSRPSSTRSFPTRRSSASSARANASLTTGSGAIAACGRIAAARITRWCIRAWCRRTSIPIEKKPLFHFLPGTLAFSIATAGCNVNCKMCQNWEISQVRPEQVRSTYVPPQKLAALAKQYQCAVIAYTYSEPVIFYEYMLDTARRRGTQQGVKSVVITGGYIQQEPLKQLCRGVDAIKVDLKAFSQKFYKEVVNGELKPVLDALVTMRKLGMWTEIVYLVVPTLNDSDAGIQGAGPLGQVGLGSGCAAALLALPSGVPAQEPAAHAARNARARQGHRRCRRASLRLPRQRSRPSGGEHVLPQVPPRRGGARGLYREQRPHSQRQMPVLPAAHCRRVGVVAADLRRARSLQVIPRSTHTLCSVPKEFAAVQGKFLDEMTEASSSRLQAV